MKTEQITLYYQQEKSDKVYKVSLEEQEGLYLVNFAYGRRGSTLKTGTKTQKAVEYEKGKKIYDKLVLSKSAKGYVVDESESDYVYVSEQVQTGIHCQLLNPIDEEELAGFIESDDWWSQEKMDGKRMLINKADDEVTAINRKGLVVGAPKAIVDAVLEVPQTFVIDGEAIDDVLYIFDLLSLEGKDLKPLAYSERYALLSTLTFSSAIKLVVLSKTSKEKEEQYKKLKVNGSEGIVYKRHTAHYHAGRPNSGGDQRKFKFYETASVIVSKINDKRSVQMMLLNGVEEVFVGNVTISPNKDVPKVGEVIEVRYLYAYKGGSLYQPTFLHVRDDIDVKECILGQLKYKKEG